MAAAAELAQAHNARLTVVEVWRESRILWGVNSSWYTVPLSLEQVVEDERAAATKRAQVACSSYGPGLVVRCRRGWMLTQVIRELRSGTYDTVVVECRRLRRRLLEAATRRYSVELVIVQRRREMRVGRESGVLVEMASTTH